MANFTRKRAGSHVAEKRLRDIHSTLDGLPSGSHAGHAHNLRGRSNLSPIMNGAILMDCTEGLEETAETHVIPRESLTRQQFLQIMPVKLETETMQGRQLDKSKVYGRLYSVEQAEKLMVRVTNERLTWKSDRNLLTRGTPGSEIGTFKREGVIRDGLNTRTYRDTEREVKAVLEDYDETRIDPVEAFGKSSKVTLP